MSQRSQGSGTRGRTDTASGNGAGAGAGAGSAAVPPRRAARRPEMIKQRRDERRATYERQQRQWQLVRIGGIALGVLVLVGIGLLVVRGVQDSQLNQMPAGTATFAYQGNDHTGSLQELVTYAESPPVGGRHAPPPFWQNCGAYNQPIQNEAAVHSLEHGAVWIAYRPDLPEDQIAQLRQRADQNYVLVSPYPELQAPIVATAWNHQLALDGPDDPRLDQFVRFFRSSRQAPEPGAACSGGVGTPL